VYLRACKKMGTRLRRCKLPYRCEIHAKVWKVAEQLSAVKHALSHNPPAKGTAAHADLTRRETKLLIDQEAIDRHLRQYNVQLPYMKAREAKLAPRTKERFEIMVWQDFVSIYSYDGGKVNNLVFTVKWKDAKGKLHTKYIDNFCSDSTRKADACYVVHIWNSLLRPNEILHSLQTEQLTATQRDALECELETLKTKTGGNFEFLGVTHILRTGDSGPHFHNRVTMRWESGVFKRCGIKWETHTLCKRHAYSLCDAHGGAVARLMARLSLEGEWPNTAQEFAAIVNRLAKSQDCMEAAWAYAYINIPREESNVWAGLREWPGMQKACEFQYNVIGPDGLTIPREDVVRFRECSGQEEETMQVYDMITRPKEHGHFCLGCSMLKQDVKYHKTNKIADCPLKSSGRSGQKYKSVVPPKLDKCAWRTPEIHIDQIRAQLQALPGLFVH
jgi:hypothetical protein